MLKCTGQNGHAHLQQPAEKHARPQICVYIYTRIKTFCYSSHDSSAGANGQHGVLWLMPLAAGLVPHRHDDWLLMVLGKFSFSYHLKCSSAKSSCLQRFIHVTVIDLMTTILAPLQILLL